MSRERPAVAVQAVGETVFLNDVDFFDAASGGSGCGGSAGFFSAIWQSSSSSPSISLDVRKGAILATPGGSKIANEDDDEGRERLPNHAGLEQIS